MSPRVERAQVVGVDGGATSARACRVERTPEGLRAVACSPARVHPVVPGFVPVLRAAADSPRSVREHQAAQAWCETLAEAVFDVLDAREGPLLVGVAAPGLKTADGRGLAWLCNGPRAPEFLAQLEARLAERVEDWHAPPVGLFSDALAAAEGECAAVDGLLRGARTGWYVGSGTGVAEAGVLAGRALALDDARLDLPRAWELDAGGATFEARLSMASLVERCGGFPETRAEDARVQRVLGEAARDLAELLARRATAWRAAGLGELERVVVGQRLGALLADPRGAALAEGLERELGERGLAARGWVVAGAAPERATLGAASLALARLEEADA